MAYSDKVLDHYNHPRNVGSFDKNSAEVGTGLVGAPECGDVMKLQIKVNPATNIIEDAKFKTFGYGWRLRRLSWPPMGSGHLRGRGAHHSQHRHRQRAVVTSGEDPLFGAGGGRHSRHHRRLEEEERADCSAQSAPVEQRA